LIPVEEGANAVAEATTERAMAVENFMFLYFL
jgi:hypothetical protein